MTTPTGGDNGLPNEVCDIIILRCNLVPRVSHLKTRDPENERECLHSKRKGLSPDFNKSEDAKGFKETVRFFTDNLMGVNNRFLSLIPRAERK